MKFRVATYLSALLALTFPVFAQDVRWPTLSAPVPSPNYPSEAKRYGIEGRSVVLALVTKTGSVARVELFKSSGFNLLDAEALRVVQRAKFKPAMSDGVARDEWIRMPINFQLDEPPAKILATEPIDLFPAPPTVTASVPISIMRDGVMYLGSQPVGLDDLKLQLESLSKERPLEVHLRADEDAPYGKVARVIAIAQSAKVPAIRFVVAAPK